MENTKEKTTKSQNKKIEIRKYNKESAHNKCKTAGI